MIGFAKILLPHSDGYPYKSLIFADASGINNAIDWCYIFFGKTGWCAGKTTLSVEEECKQLLCGLERKIYFEFCFTNKEDMAVFNLTWT
jgi:hypothetical protein